MEPPALLYTNIIKKLEQEDQAFDKKIEILKDHSIPPPEAHKTFEQVLLSIETAPLESKLRELKEDAQQADKKVQKRIFKRTFLNRKTVIIPIFKKAIAVAAGLLFIFAIWKLLDTQKTTTLPQSIAHINPSAAPAPIKKDSAAMITAAIKNPLQPKYKNSKPAPATHSLSIMQVNGEDLKIIDNDIIGSFASFANNKIPSFIFAPDQEKVILRIDKSTSISISEGMRTMMRKMYSTRRNGAPRNVAKKMKKRLLKWQQIDSRYFDHIPGKNPMDPIDLGNIIF